MDIVEAYQNGGGKSGCRERRDWSNEARPLHPVAETDLGLLVLFFGDGQSDHRTALGLSRHSPPVAILSTRRIDHNRTTIHCQLPPSFVQLFYRLEWWRASSLDGRFRHRRKRVGEFFTQSVDKSMQERFLLASSGISIGHLGGMNELLIARVEHSIVRVFLFLI